MIFGIDRWPADNVALISENGEIWNYGRLIETIDLFQKTLSGRQLVFCLCSNVPEAVAGYMGLLEQGSVSLLLSDHMDGQQLSALVNTYRPSYIYKPACIELRSALFQDETLRKAGPVIHIGNYGLYRTGYEPCELDSALSLLLSTSGSTGSPKLIRLSKKNLESNAYSIAKYLELDNKERPVTTLPLYYTFGLSVINSHMCVGACTLMTTKSIVQQQFWDFLKSYGGTSISGVPYTYEILKRIHIFSRDDTGSITSMIQAGGHLPVELQEEYGNWCQKRGIRFYVMYGQTEATARMSYLPWKDVLRKIGSIGIAIPGGTFELQDENGNVIESADTIGELVYRGDNVSLGYAECMEDLAKPDERSGVLHTGDMASRDDEGYYRITGRLNRFVKLYGNRVGLDECENILKGLDEESIFACTGSDDRLVIYTDSPRFGEAAEYLSSRLKINIRAFEAVYLENIPVKESGKIDYKALGKS